MSYTCTMGLNLTSVEYLEISEEVFVMLKRYKDLQDLSRYTPVLCVASASFAGSQDS